MDQSAPPARRLLEEFARREGLRGVDVARALDVSKALVSQWFSGHLVPGALYRLKIERWTGGAVKARDWLTAEERRELAATRRYRRAEAA